MARGTSLNVQNALVVVKGPSALTVVGSDGQAHGPYGESIRRDWRKLRDRLPNLFLRDNYDRAAIAQWLNDAGYIADSPRGFVAFSKALVTRGVEKTVYNWARLVSWGMDTFDPTEVKRHSNRAPVTVPQQRRLLRRYQRSLQKALVAGYPAPPTASLLDEIGGAPEDLDFHDLELFVLGMGSTRPLPAAFSLDRSSRPIFEIETESPMHAITLTVFIDRVFTHRKLATCKFCGQTFSRRSDNQMFCPGREGALTHRSLWNIKFRRDKVKAVKKAYEKAGTNWERVSRLAATYLGSNSLYAEEPVEKLRVPPEWAKAVMRKERKR